MIIRELKPEERKRVKHIFKDQFDELLPFAPTSVIVVAEEKGEIVGLLCARLLLHAEPLWVKDGQAHLFIVPKLVKKLRECLPDASYAFAGTKFWKVGRLLERLGFTKQPYETYLWQRSKNG